ncbi:hypothetical protein HDV03_003381 [Kappamyces sp. JEL0829]|nr:hypothetical protein HDV03_003381 [Kappamyces sp. JEL0829]
MTLTPDASLELPTSVVDCSSSKDQVVCRAGSGGSSTDLDLAAFIAFCTWTGDLARVSSPVQDAEPSPGPDTRCVDYVVLNRKENLQRLLCVIDQQLVVLELDMVFDIFSMRCE